MKFVVLLYFFLCQPMLAGVAIEELIDKLCSSSALGYFVEITEGFMEQADGRWSDRLGVFVDAEEVQQAGKVDELEFCRADSLLRKMDGAEKYLDISKKYSDYIAEIDSLVKISVWLQENAGEPSSSYWGRDYFIDKLKDLLGCYGSSSGADIAISMDKLNPQKKKTDIDAYIRKMLDKPEYVSAQELRQIATKEWLDNYQFALDKLGLLYNQKLRASRCKEENRIQQQEEEKRIQKQKDKKMIASLLADFSIVGGSELELENEMSR